MASQDTNKSGRKISAPLNIENKRAVTEPDTSTSYQQHISPSSLPGTSPFWYPYNSSPTPNMMPWAAPWMAQYPFPGRNDANTNFQNINPHSTENMNSDYMVDSFRKIYNNETGSIEIERVKVKKCANLEGNKMNTLQPECQSLVPIGAKTLNERRPPPRKNKLKRQMIEMEKKAKQLPSSQIPIAQPWHPYMPHMPMGIPYPYLYYYGFPTWPGYSPNPSEFDQLDPNSPTEPHSIPMHETSSVQNSVPSYSNTESQIDIAPSDSISIEYNRDTSLDRDVYSSQPIESVEFISTDVDKYVSESFLENSKLNAVKDSEEKMNNIPKPPVRKNKTKRIRSFSADKSQTSDDSTIHDNSFDQKENNLSLAFRDLKKSVQDFTTQISLQEIADFSDKSEKDQNIKTENTENNENEIINIKSENPSQIILVTESDDSKKIDSQNNLELPELKNKSVSCSVIPEHVSRVLDSAHMYEKNAKDSDTSIGILDETLSHGSTASFFSTRPSTDEQLVQIKSSPREESKLINEQVKSSSPIIPSVEDNNEDYAWVIQQPGDAPEFINNESHISKEDERRNKWRAEVSLWRAKLIVSLCRGGGLDKQDWATFQLLVLHPLSLDLKLSLLHAPRLCGGNSSIGAGLVRSALLHLTRYGEILLQPESGRPSGWKSIKVNSTQPWAPMKGSVEILRTLGYKPREDGVLRYPRRPTIETSILARLTLDMLVLAEELRLYITGTHSYSSNISRLFFPSTNSVPISPEPNNGFQSSVSMPYEPELSSEEIIQRPSSVNSCGFFSAQSNASIDGDIVSSASDEDLTVTSGEIPDLPKKKNIGVNDCPPPEYPVKIKRTKLKRRHAPDPPEIKCSEIRDDKIENQSEIKTAIISTNSVSPDITSLPDLSTVSSSSSSRHSEIPLRNFASSSESLTPVASPELNVNIADPINCETNKQIMDNKSNLKDNINDSSIISNEQPDFKVKNVVQSTSEVENKKSDEHIYEEITEIRAQAAALKAKETRISSGKAAPPPLPPKAKHIESSKTASGLSLVYPCVDWSARSESGSVRGGSTGAKRRKRRAPLPPDFMPLNWYNKEKAFSESNLNPCSDQITSDASVLSETELTNKWHFDYNKQMKDSNINSNPTKENTNPFENDIEEKNNEEVNNKNAHFQRSLNPFEEELEPIGYVGKNPFYEDVEIVKMQISTNQEILKTKPKETLIDIHNISEEHCAAENRLVDSEILKCENEIIQLSMDKEESRSLVQSNERDRGGEDDLAPINDDSLKSENNEFILQQMEKDKSGSIVQNEDSETCGDDNLMVPIIDDGLKCENEITLQSMIKEESGSLIQHNETDRHDDTEIMVSNKVDLLKDENRFLDIPLGKNDENEITIDYSNSDDKDCNKSQPTTIENNEKDIMADDNCIANDISKQYMDNSEENMTLNKSTSELKSSSSENIKVEDFHSDSVKQNDIFRKTEEQKDMFRTLLTKVMNSDIYIPEDSEAKIDINKESDDFDSCSNTDISLEENADILILKDDVTHEQFDNQDSKNGTDGNLILHKQDSNILEENGTDRKELIEIKLSNLNEENISNNSVTENKSLDIDDIPFIDDFKKSHSNSPNTIESETDRHCDTTEKPATKNLALIPPIPEYKNRECIFRLGSPSNTPYIKENDIPPDNEPPPPPPANPPPSESPHPSPPETPHTSPPSTPECVHMLKNDCIDKKFNKSGESIDQIVNYKDDSIVEEKYEIPVVPEDIPPQKVTTENERTECQDGYEIPDIVKNESRQNPSSNLRTDSRVSGLSSFVHPREAFEGIRKSFIEGFPLKPPRGRRSMGIPPRPPKLFQRDHDLPPPLPPKGIMPFRLSRRSNGTLTPVTNVSRSVTVTPTFSSKCSSTASTPTSTRSKPKTLNLKILKRNRKRTKSWPFMLCDCMYMDYYEDVK